MRRLLTCWTAVAALVLTTGAAAETRLSRARAIALARQQNPRVAASRAGEVEAAALKGQADAARWPRLELEAGAGPSEKAAIAPGTVVGSTRSAYDFSWSDLTVTVGGRLQVLQPLYTFGKIGYRRRAAAHGLEAAGAQTRMTQAEVALEVARLYELQLFAQEAELIFKEAVRIADRSVATARQRLQEGSTSFRELDLLRLRVAQSSARMALAQARTGIAQARAGLAAYLGLPQGGRLLFAEGGLGPVGRVGRAVDGLVALGLRHRPELRALTEGIAAYAALARAEWAGYLPDLFALGQITAAYTPGRELVDSRYYTDPLHSFVPAVLVGLRWTLWANMPGQRAREARAKGQRLQALLDWARAGIPAEVRVAYEEALRAQKDVDEAGRALPLAKQWMVRASADFAAGLGTARDLTDAVTAYLTMRLARMDAVLRLNLGLARLAQATGTLVDGSGPYPGRS